MAMAWRRVVKRGRGVANRLTYRRRYSIMDIVKEGGESMVSDAQRKASRKYDAKTYTMVSVRLKKELVTRFKAKCLEDGISQAHVIKEAIEKYLGDR